MANAPFDPGLSQNYAGDIQRVINPDGSFNVRRINVPFRSRDLYQHLINLSWSRFLLIMLAGYVLINLFFAGLYVLIGVNQLRGADMDAPLISFLNAFFFSAQTFTTVGYGGIAPQGIAANMIAALEAMTGLMSFAVATGLLYGRFSRPNARMAFSRQAIIAPYQGRSGLMFRVVNERPSVLKELAASVLLMTVENRDGQLKRIYRNLELERSTIQFLPLMWTVVHPIDTNSPLYGKTQQEVMGLRAEVLVMIRAFDDTFSQTVHATYSYPVQEWLWGARFVPGFHIDEHENMIVDVSLVHRAEPATLPDIVE